MSTHELSTRCCKTLNRRCGLPPVIRWRLTSSPQTRLADVRALLQVLENDHQPACVRGTAYDGLLILHQRPRFPSMEREFRPTTGRSPVLSEGMAIMSRRKRTIGRGVLLG